MNNILSEDDIKWISNIDFNNNIKYELEIRIRIPECIIYEKLISEFKNMAKEFGLIYTERNIQDDIIYSDKFKIVKRREDKRTQCYSKKKMIWKYLDYIPGMIFLNTEKKYDLMLFDKNTSTKVRINKKRYSFSNEKISFDFTKTDVNECSVELEVLDLTKCNLQKLITDGLNKLLMLLPENMIIMHKLNRYKKYIKQPVPLKNIEH